ncbi:achilleol B synthase-like [Panicum virgatum]|uniref:achilleol B synthase-like n=1 Tax=Panicum virgatum TaxID=38727 RepID=UPI0019D6698F|nr:achilleol B synthase-like [Panicum virgatum]
MWRLKISEGGGQRIVWLMYRNEDGGWGFNVLDESAMFGTCLNYVTLRLLGQVQKDENDGLAKGRSWILSHGTATAAPQWAKILLSVLGVYDWSGNRPVIPELCLVPRFLPIHPDVEPSEEFEEPPSTGQFEQQENFVPGDMEEYTQSFQDFEDF